VFWFSGWQPRNGLAIGISFVVDPFGATLVVLACLIAAASFVFAAAYFDDVEAKFHALMLLFVAAMCGFSLSGDLFNLFVFFELMSAAAIALCGYKIEEPGPLQGALNFGVTNALAAFLMLIGLSLLYGRTGALNLAQIRVGLAGHADPLVAVAFTLLAVGFLTKGAIVPFHFWLPDAHAVAPTPVCALFSGIMVELGLYAVARLYWVVFEPSLAAHAHGLTILFVTLGAITAIAGGLMAIAQRHIKRLLAFSTVSHAGVMLIAIGVFTHDAIAGLLLYIVAHGLIKATLFLCSGIVLHRKTSIDEIELQGQGGDLKLVGALFTLAALGLSGLPLLGLAAGESWIAEGARTAGAWAGAWVLPIASVLTGASALRVAGRVFAGWGPKQEGAARKPTLDEEVPEVFLPHDRTPPQMLLATAAVAVCAIAVALLPSARQIAVNAGAQLTDGAAYEAAVLGSVAPRAARVERATAESPAPPPTHPVHGVRSSLIAIALMALLLSGGSGRRSRLLHALRKPALRLRRLQNGHVPDYVAWLMVGTAVVGVWVMVVVRGG
jgi:multicomponent Na+:H+ antiporter subunit D